MWEVIGFVALAIVAIVVRNILIKRFREMNKTVVLFLLISEYL